MKQYSVYKDSGVKWVGKIPSEWGLIRLKYLTSFRNGYAFDSDEYAEDGLPIMRIGDVSGSIDLEAMKKVPKDYEKLQYEFGINYGDVLLALTGATIGKTAVFNLHEKVLLNQRVAIIRPRKKLDNGYLKYIVAFSGFKRHIDFECEGGAQDNIGKGEVGDFLTPLPDLTEQKVIADCLDRKTAQIDGLIAKKERMIELLKEERTAIINQAVTKGLDPSVAMKDSGIEWLGKVPKHWEVKKLKYLVQGKLEYGANEVAELDDQCLPRYIRITDFDDDGNLREDTFKSLSEDKARGYLLNEGDILFARSGATVGKTFQFKNYAGKACFAGYLIQARPNEEILLSDFLCYYTRSNAYENWKNSIFNQATIQNIGADKYSVLPLPLPSVAEQKGIVDFIIAKCKRIDGIISRGQQSLELLKEFRTSLIAEVVTGRIDVRGVANG